MVRRMCGVKAKDRFPSKELRKKLGTDDINIGTATNQAATV